MVILNIKPLSVNVCWKGQRFRTKEYKNYETEVMYLLKKIMLPQPPFALYYEFGVSSKGFDIDNGIKPITDILQKRFGFNDNQVYELHVIKKIVKKRQEYIKFEIKKLGV